MQPFVAPLARRGHARPRGLLRGAEALGHQLQARPGQGRARPQEGRRDAVHDVPPRRLQGPERDPAGRRPAPRLRRQADARTSRPGGAPTTPATWRACRRRSAIRTSTTWRTIWPVWTERQCLRLQPGGRCVGEHDALGAVEAFEVALDRTQVQRVVVPVHQVERTPRPIGLHAPAPASGRPLRARAARPAHRAGGRSLRRRREECAYSSSSSCTRASSGISTTMQRPWSRMRAISASGTRRSPIFLLSLSTNTGRAGSKLRQRVPDLRVERLLRRLRPGRAERRAPSRGGGRALRGRAPARRRRRARCSSRVLPLPVRAADHAKVEAAAAASRDRRVTAARNAL